jgi:hypothetical protein
VGNDSQAHDATRISHLDFLLSRSAALGQSQAHVGSPPWCLVGCQQDWHVTAAARNTSRMADDLSRRPQDAIKLYISAWPGPLRSSAAGKMPTSRGFLDICARGRLRTSWRCSRCCVSLRIYGGIRWRHHQSLLRRRRFEHCVGARQHSLSSRLAGCEWPFRAGTGPCYVEQESKTTSVTTRLRSAFYSVDHECGRTKRSISKDPGVVRILPWGDWPCLSAAQTVGAT